MERTKGKMRWKKIGGGSLRLVSGRIIKPNEIFRADPSEISMSFRDRVIPLDAISEEMTPVPDAAFEIEKVSESNEVLVEELLPVEDTAPSASTEEYEMVQAAAGWYRVVNVKTRKVVNEKMLRKHEADKLLQALLT